MGGRSGDILLSMRGLVELEAIRLLEAEGAPMAEVLKREAVISRECGKLGFITKVGIPENTSSLIRELSRMPYWSGRNARRALSDSIATALRDMGYKNPRVKCGWFSIRARGL